MQVQSEVMEPDGSAWCAVLVVKGVIYRASYVANRLSCSLGPYKHAPRRPSWALEAVRRWAEARVAALPAAWLEAHREMYAEPA